MRAIKRSLKNLKYPKNNMEKVNYDKKTEEVINSLSGKPTLLLHSCCAPCSTACLERLFPYFNITVFYFNPNITESKEYYIRLDEQKRFLQEVYGDKVKLIEGRYLSREFFDMAEGLDKEPEGGKRCYKCYEMRLNETAITAKRENFDYFCTTLSVTPHINSEWINEIGNAIGEQYGVKFLPSDFKKQNGYKKSIDLSKEYNLYRQNYCGCIYSKYAHISEEN